ncbi:hypothetical protein N1028_03915 [Herbiconiux sp. CPCC 203407]|uniref:Uncharacterized protein n=1 Tax=Herbiconiux oxytropis TaxID=2970915 RepID=A0AA41XG28_9MICO|nr:hypothetical protein [Herbiconiux oxytropis]MCS5720638.1 hypothetical protein [Herbiconiux oxytropis]MCS5725035.1 hypothetical protein [Herbiconiux oxytropis]
MLLGAAMITVGLSGCLGSGPQPLAADEVRDAFRRAAESYGTFASHYSTRETLRIALDFGLAPTLSIEGLTVAELDRYPLRSGQPMLYRTEPDALAIHVIAYGYAQLQGFGGSSDAYAHACATLTATPGSTEVSIEKVDCPEPVQTGIASHTGTAVDPR